MSAHRLPRDAICPYCFKRKTDRNGVEAHIKAKHSNNLARVPDDNARAKLQAYHQDRLRAVRGNCDATA